jgi:alkylated DNA nucleotide flippase Atl1
MRWYALPAGAQRCQTCWIRCSEAPNSTPSAVQVEPLALGVVSGPVKRTKNRLKPEAAFASVFQGLPEYARKVLDVVDQIPVGKVMAYGDIAEYLAEGGPRQVAQVMSRYGSPVPWHRVLRADGSCAPEVAIEQYKLLAEESVVWRRSGRVDMSQSRWDGT